MANRSTEDLESGTETGSREDDEPNDCIGTSDGIDRSTGNDTPDIDDDAHLEDVPVGAGCTEIWEHLTARRETAGIEDDAPTDRNERASE